MTQDESYVHTHDTLYEVKNDVAGFRQIDFAVYEIIREVSCDEVEKAEIPAEIKALYVEKEKLQKRLKEINLLIN